MKIEFFSIYEKDIIQMSLSKAITFYKESGLLFCAEIADQALKKLYGKPTSFNLVIERDLKDD